MHIKSIIAGAAIALVAGLASASAAQESSPLKALTGVPGERMTPDELSDTRGSNGIGLVNFLTGTQIAIDNDPHFPKLRNIITGLVEEVALPGLGHGETPVLP